MFDAECFAPPFATLRRLLQVSVDRADIESALKDICRTMATRTTGDVKKIKGLHGNYSTRSDWLQHLVFNENRLKFKAPATAIWLDAKERRD